MLLDFSRIYQAIGRTSDELLAANAEALSVTDVAIINRFFLLGRFTAAYRHSFGLVSL